MPRGANVIDMSGTRFGKLLVLSRDPTRGKRARWQCRCDCGRVTSVAGVQLRRGHRISCGCSRGGYAHGHGRDGRKSSTYISWRSMIGRCYQPSVAYYSLYGGRGITVCERWRGRGVGFVNFLADMGERPSKSHTLDRIDSSGHYEPANCRWATATEQSRNTRAVVLEPHEPSQIRWLAGSYTRASIARLLGVSAKVVELVVKGVTWRGA
jgi:hypothetical protein